MSVTFLCSGLEAVKSRMTDLSPKPLASIPWSAGRTSRFPNSTAGSENLLRINFEDDEFAESPQFFNEDLNHDFFPLGRRFVSFEDLFNSENSQNADR
jgi:hypothetical protein